MESESERLVDIEVDSSLEVVPLRLPELLVRCAIEVEVKYSHGNIGNSESSYAGSIASGVKSSSVRVESHLTFVSVELEESV